MATAASDYPSGTPSLLRSLNARTVLELIRESGPISRAQIARESGLSKPTVSLALDRLVDRSVVREVGRTSGGKGPAALLYQLDPGAGTVVGIDVGRGWIRAAVADLSGQVVAQQSRRNAVRSASAVIDLLGVLLEDLLRDAGVRRSEVTSWVLGTPGIVRPGASNLELATNLPGWGKASVLEKLRDLVGDVVLENDVNLATIAEHRFGRGRGVDDFVVVSIGTGVGMGLVLGGQLYAGATGAAGEIGFLPIGDAVGRKAKRGLLEADTGAAAVVRDARNRGMTGRLTAESVFNAAREGDSVALSVVEAEAGRVGLAVAAVASVVDPALVVLGGGIGHNADLLLDGVQRRLVEVSPLRPEIAVSDLGKDAVLRGAIATALDLARSEVFDKATDNPATLSAALA